MRELLRQAIHLLFGLGIACLVLLAGRDASIAILAGGLLAGVILVDLVLRGHAIPVISPLLAHLDRDDPLPGRGAFFFAVSALFCVIIFPENIVVPALVALAVLDSVTTVTGRRFGRHRIYNGKTWEGSLAGIAAAAVALLVFLPPSGALPAALVAGITELVSPVDDNLVIPVAVCLLLAAFPALL